MKPASKLIQTLISAFSLILIIMTSCSNNAADTVNPSLQGSWKISLFWDNTDETADFAAYTFSFNDGGVISATNGTTTKTGTWSETSTKLTIDFGTDPLFSELNDDWLKEEKTATSIKLKEDNPAQDDRLQFVKL